MKFTRTITFINGTPDLVETVEVLDEAPVAGHADAPAYVVRVLRSTKSSRRGRSVRISRDPAVNETRKALPE